MVRQVGLVIVAQGQRRSVRQIEVQGGFGRKVGRGDDLAHLVKRRPVPRRTPSPRETRVRARCEHRGVGRRSRNPPGSPFPASLPCCVPAFADPRRHSGSGLPRQARTSGSTWAVCSRASNENGRPTGEGQKVRNLIVELSERKDWPASHQPAARQGNNRSGGRGEAPRRDTILNRPAHNLVGGGGDQKGFQQVFVFPFGKGFTAPDSPVSDGLAQAGARSGANDQRILAYSNIFAMRRPDHQIAGRPQLHLFTLVDAPRIFQIMPGAIGDFQNARSDQALQRTRQDRAACGRTERDRVGREPPSARRRKV